MNKKSAVTPTIKNILDDLTTAEIEAIEKIGIKKHFKASTYIAHKQSALDYIYRIDSGYAINERMSYDGKRHVMAFLSSGYYIGFFDLLSLIPRMRALFKYPFHAREFPSFTTI